PLIGLATLENYQTVLRSVTYQNTSDNPGTSTRTISFVASDGELSSAAGTRTVAISAVNDAPTNTVPAAQSTNEDTGKTFSSGNANAISISDIDAGVASVQVTLTGTNGSITLSGTTGLTFSAG